MIEKPVNPDSLRTEDDLKNAIVQLQETMKSFRCAMPEAEHLFCNGVYCRKFTMPEGMLVVGKEHKHEHPMMVLKGKAVIVTSKGKETVEAGHLAISPAGAKRAVLALEETIFVTVHHNPENEQDLDKIESEHIVDEGFDKIFHQKIEGVIE